MKKMLIYPFTKEMCPLIRYRHMLDGYELVTTIPAKGFDWEGKDICELDGGDPADFILKESLDNELKSCDAVLFNAAAQMPEGELADIKKLVRKSKKELLNVKSSDVLKATSDLQPDKRLQDIPVPVIMVMGQGESCQKFDIQLGLRDAFVKEGYKVLQFGSSIYSSLFGFSPLPSAPDVSLWKKVYLYNDLFKSTYKQEKPDVMIIGIPGGMMPLNSRIYEKFGEIALAVTHAAKPDITLLSYYYVMQTGKYFESLRTYVYSRLGVDNLFFHASNTRLIDNEDLEELSYLTLKSRFVSDEIQRQAKDSTCKIRILVKKCLLGNSDSLTIELMACYAQSGFVWNSMKMNNVT